MRTLFLPIHAPGSYAERSRANKHGLPSALMLYGDVRELDYLSVPDVDTALRSELDSFQPDLLFTQIQGATTITADMLARIRADYPALPVVNWNGDYWPEHLTSPEMLDILRHVDLQLVVNGSVLDAYNRAGVKADYCPFGYEAPLGALPDVPTYDVLFLGNNYSEKRQRLYDALRSLDGVRVGVYGSGWPQSEGECNYDFATAQALYQRARVAVSDSQFPEARGYLSDRPFQIMAAGGALLLQQIVKDIEPMTGLRVGQHYMPFDDIDNLARIVRKWLREDKEDDRTRMVRRAQDFVLERHTWKARVDQLVNQWLPEIGRVKA